MCKWINLLILAAWLALATQPAQAQSVGRSATAAEIAAWNIDVRPDFQGLPKGAGSVARGQQVWDAKCASCHGSFGESNQVFMPIVGGTTKKDIQSGRVAALANNKEPQRTSLMKLATVSTLWDYINRAMPWTEPKTLSVEDVYAVTAYILNLGDIVPENFVLNQDNIRTIQLPNRNGMQQEHGLWRTDGKPDVKNTACVKNCGTPANITSRLPAHAMNSHGDLTQQNRLIGPVRGLATSVKTTAISPSTAPAATQLLQQHQCLACHANEQKVIGPSWRSIAEKYKGQDGAEARLLQKLKDGGAGVWGEMPMPPQAHLPQADLQQMLKWILQGAK